MLYKILKKDDYSEFLKKLISGYNLVGPVKRDSAVHDFSKIKDVGQIDTDIKKTTIPPAKKILFPSTEKLITYEIDDVIKVKAPIESEEIILFGIDACDVNAINFYDRFFSTDFVDENYFEKRNKLTVIGLDRMPTDTSFALSMGMEYAKEGFDLFLTDLGDRYFARIATEKGNELIENHATTSPATEKDFRDYDKWMDEYRSQFKLAVNVDSFYDNFEIVYDDEEFWNKVSEKCYSCGSCNLVCPTCFCFNVRDDMELNLKTGNKTREWDSCMIPNYGLVAGGHNFRPTKANRLKQRYRCKIKTFIDRFGTYACVGCGRCIEACLAKINIAEDVNSVKKEVNL